MRNTRGPLPGKDYRFAEKEENEKAVLYLRMFLRKFLPLSVSWVKRVSSWLGKGYMPRFTFPLWQQLKRSL